MIKETMILTSTAKDWNWIYESVDDFFEVNGLSEWRAKELKLFTDAGFDFTDSAKHMVQLNEDGTKVIITVAYADQAEKDAIFANADAGEGPAGLTQYITEDHLF